LILLIRRLIGILVVGVPISRAACGSATAQPGSKPPSTAPLSPTSCNCFSRRSLARSPDSLVALILAAATYPTQIVEAERFLQQHPELAGKKLGKEVDHQDWET